MRHYKGWTQWNVSLWLANDERLYRTALDYIRYTRTKEQAAKLMLELLHESGITETPDGARYSVTTIRKAMVDLSENGPPVSPGKWKSTSPLAPKLP